MNKIQRAIYETKASLKYLKKQRTDLNGQINAYREQLEALEHIETSDSYPHVEVIPNTIIFTGTDSGASSMSTANNNTYTAWVNHINTTEL